MTVYSFYLFNRSGTCLLYHEWKRPHQVHTADDDQKTMFGMLFALRNFSIKLSSTASQPINTAATSTTTSTITSTASSSAATDPTNSRSGASGANDKNQSTTGAGLVTTSVPTIITSATNSSSTNGTTFNAVTPGMPRYFITDSYALHYFETMTGLRFVLTTSNDFGDIDISAHLQHIYADIFVTYVVKNPLYTVSTPIAIPIFNSKLDQYVRQLPCF